MTKNNLKIVKTSKNQEVEVKDKNRSSTKFSDKDQKNVNIEINQTPDTVINTEKT